MIGANSLRNLAAPQDALRLLLESVVISFTYDEPRRRFSLVCDHPERAQGSDRAFAAFMFDGVRDFVRERGDLAKFYRFVHAYRAAEDATPVVIQALPVSEPGTMECWFGPNFGGLRFTYDTLSGAVRDTRVRRSGASFLYLDSTSGEELDFFHPFPELEITQPPMSR